MYIIIIIIINLFVSNILNDIVYESGNKNLLFFVFCFVIAVVTTNVLYKSLGFSSCLAVLLVLQTISEDNKSGAVEAGGNDDCSDK